MDGNYNTQMYNAVAPRNGRILPNKKWTLENYQDFFSFIRIGYIVQDLESICFIVNPAWDGDDFTEVFSLRCQIEESERERDARPTLEEVQAFSERIGRDYKKLFSK